MNRDYTTGKKDNVTIFGGTEVEHTVMYGEKTLFVVGPMHDYLELMDLCEKHSCNHIYLGANMSFKILHLNDYDRLATQLLEHDYYVTLDFDVQYTEDISNCEAVKYDKFIPMISVKIPNADRLGYNACVKIDDKDFRASNFGVWTHRLRRLMSDRVFTPWSKYTKDTVIK